MCASRTVKTQRPPRRGSSSLDVSAREVLRTLVIRSGRWRPPADVADGLELVNVEVAHVPHLREAEPGVPSAHHMAYLREEGRLGEADLRGLVPRRVVAGSLPAHVGQITVVHPGRRRIASRPTWGKSAGGGVFARRRMVDAIVHGSPRADRSPPPCVTKTATV
jgi:hypothetical protein